MNQQVQVLYWTVVGLALLAGMGLMSIIERVWPLPRPCPEGRRLSPGLYFREPAPPPAAPEPPLEPLEPLSAPPPVDHSPLTRPCAYCDGRDHTTPEHGFLAAPYPYPAPPPDTMDRISDAYIAGRHAQQWPDLAPNGHRADPAPVPAAQGSLWQPRP